MLKEHAMGFYMEDGCNCAEAVLMAANAEYDLGLTEEACKLVGGFGGGVGCGATCGTLLGAVAALGAMKMGRRARETYGFNNECGKLARAFQEKLGDTECAQLARKYATMEQRCLKTVLAACDVLEEHLAQYPRG